MYNAFCVFFRFFGVTVIQLDEAHVSKTNSWDLFALNVYKNMQRPCNLEKTEFTDAKTAIRFTSVEQKSKNNGQITSNFFLNSKLILGAPIIKIQLYAHKLMKTFLERRRLFKVHCSKAEQNVSAVVERYLLWKGCRTWFLQKYIKIILKRKSQKKFWIGCPFELTKIVNVNPGTPMDFKCNQNTILYLLLVYVYNHPLEHYCWKDTNRYFL